MRNRSVTIWAVVGVSVITGISQAELQGYVATWSEVYSTNFSGTNTSLGPSGIVDIRAIDTSPIDGTLYAADDAGQLWTINTDTGVGSLIGNMGRRIDAISFAPDGTLYAIYNCYQLRIIDTATAQATIVGDLFSSQTLAIDRVGKGISIDTTTNTFFEINLADASTTSQGVLLSLPGVDALDYGPDGVLYGYDWESSSLYSIDVDNLTFIHVGNSVNGRSMAMIPEPTTLLLLGLGTVMLRRKR